LAKDHVVAESNCEDGCCSGRHLAPSGVGSIVDAKCCRSLCNCAH
jgi:hypothetical protein